MARSGYLLSRLEAHFAPAYTIKIINRWIVPHWNPWNYCVPELPSYPEKLITFELRIFRKLSRTRVRSSDNESFTEIISLLTIDNDNLTKIHPSKNRTNNCIKNSVSFCPLNSTSIPLLSDQLDFQHSSFPSFSFPLRNLDRLINSSLLRSQWFD